MNKSENKHAIMERLDKEKAVVRNSECDSDDYSAHSDIFQQFITYLCLAPRKILSPVFMTLHPLVNSFRKVIVAESKSIFLVARTDAVPGYDNQDSDL